MNIKIDRAKVYIEIGKAAVKVREWCTEMKHGADVSDADIDRIRKIAEKIAAVRWGYRGPEYRDELRRIEMPEPACYLTTWSLFALAHEIQHAKQDTEGRLLTRTWCTTPTGSVEVGWDIVCEEWEATMDGWKLLLEEDMFHPSMIVYGIKSWLTYFGSWAAGWAYKAWEDESQRVSKKSHQAKLDKLLKVLEQEVSKCTK